MDEEEKALRLVRYLHSNVESYGLLTTEEEIIDLPALSGIMKRPLPSSLLGLVSLGMEGTSAVESLMCVLTEDERKEAAIPMKNVSLLTPLASPPKIICLGLNYRDHAEEQGARIPDEPIIFFKPRTALIGPDEPILRPGFVKQLDYEAELAVVIGRKGKNISVADAEKHIFGYTAFNDVSARDIQSKDRQWTRGKSFDTFAPTGPCITTANQVDNPQNLRIRTRVNGELRQNSSTKNMAFNVYAVIHHISRVMTIEPGDIIATGTPAGVAVFMKPQPRFLSPGDIVEVEIEKIGTLRNKVIEE